MGCKTCKDKKVNIINVTEDIVTVKNEVKVYNRVVGFIIFVLSMALIPILIPVIIGILFNHLVIQRNLNLLSIIKKTKKKASGNDAIIEDLNLN